ncbi:MAG: hypothetical protein R3B96_19570 [Pirellulaceae bacterium]
MRARSGIARSLANLDLSTVPVPPDISGIKALKRRIEVPAASAGHLDANHLTNVGSRHRPPRDVKSGLGGIRDIEFCIQFLQLLNGGDLPAIRVGTTLDAISALAKVGD